MNYYLDTEFLEGPQTKRFFGIKTGMTSNTIDLISIGIVSEDGREYYAISKDFNLKEAWNRFQIKETSPAKKYMGFYEEKEYWIRENVLKPIFNDWIKKDSHWTEKDVTLGNWSFTYKNFKYFLKKYGKTNKEIAKEIVFFTLLPEGKHLTSMEVSEQYRSLISRPRETMRYKPNFYAYYADYDWVVFCWLFGNMMSLPKSFPMYCIDLKQIYDEENIWWTTKVNKSKNKPNLKDASDYPKNENEHSALDDARWNLKLHQFLNKIRNPFIR